ncbi:response regulator [Asticcacaulis sp. SL142]|jgi:CheY-like chemotaxis protein|uniref:response regulator n=1 Tax=Asticcacaulis sp. SL142 TaxID=2995155 RepID=UPI00226CFE2F|nr:response regulator [Asticcacaulis sp. SL142]WAC48972.1 response regulator [Asticcacaulis sp. SL142]
MSLGTVLILEDSRVQAQLISRILEGLGCLTLVSHDLKTTYSMLRDFKVNLMLLDVYVGDGNSLKFIPNLRERAPDVPVAVMTSGGAGGAALEETLAMARQAEADFVLAKPFTPHAIANILTQTKLIKATPIRRRHMLVIDDCRIVRKLVATALDDKGYRVSEAGSMEEALERVDIAHVDVVITDIFMPGMGGLEGINIIRSQWPEVHVIAMSAGAELEQFDCLKALSAARKVGSTAQLPKPFTASDLTMLVDAVLSEKFLAA